MEIGDVVAIITAAGVLVYVVGLVGLAVTIRMDLTHDFSTAWYVVSLLPRAVVAGQGLRIWFGWPIILTLALLSLALSMRVLHTSLWSHAWYVFVLTVAYLTSFLSRKRSKAVLMSGFKQFIRGDSFIFLSILVYLPSFFIVGGVIYFGVQSIRDGFILLTAQQTAPLSSIEIIQPLAQEHPLSTGAVLLFVGCFCIGLPAAITVDPPFPSVAITLQKGAAVEGLPSPLKGRLVVHTDGFWYLFPEQKKKLVSIPDSSVLVVGSTEGDAT